MSASLGTDELRTLFLFEALTDAQLAWIDERGETRTYDGGAVVYREGDVADCVFVLLSGSIRMTRMANGEEVVVNETGHRGSYAGALRAYVTREGDEPELYTNSVLTREPSRFLRLTADDFSELMHTWFPMAVHLLDGLYLGIRNSEATVRQREHLAQLGTLSANLAHELNNPAAAAVRATGQLRQRVAGMRHKLGMIAENRVDPAQIAKLVACQELAVERAAKAHEPLTPVQEADREDAFVERLEELGVTAAYDLAPVFAAAGLDDAWLEEVVAGVATTELDGPLRWLAYTLETEALMDEIEDATGRISTLVAAVKQYSYVDSSSVQEVDLHVGLDSTVVMLGHKLQGVRVVKDYDRSLPRVPVYAAELNQVWTNLIDNAADAMGGTGELVLRSRREGDEAVLEVADDGPGIPPQVQPRVFEAFFTTKAPGQGSGLGLEGARRIVEKRHHGALSFTTSDEGTCFQVRLPLVQDLV